MADDPRTEPLARALFERAGFPFPWAAAQQPYWLDTATAQLAKLDAKDPLRALLADEDRAVEVLRAAIAGSDNGALSSRQLIECADAVLAALREVAGL